VSELDEDDPMNVIDDDLSQLIPHEKLPVAVRVFDPLSIIVTLLPRATKGIGAVIVTDVSRTRILESLISIEFACVEPVTVIWAPLPSCELCPEQVRKLLDILTEACTRLQLIVI
jgi:hypothetical protein